MQSLAFATNTVGISLEKLGDISKDTNEKVAEFIATGGGGFQDFADVMGLTALEARKVAEEFESMSGPDVLQSMVTQMELAGVSTGRMSFALEGMASDATDLIPLLKDNGESVKSLREEFDELNVSLSAADVSKIKEVSTELEKATSIFSAEGKQLIADYSDELITAINVTVTIAQKTSDAFNVITTGFGNMIDLAGAALNDFVNGTDTFAQVLAERTAESAEVLNELIGQDFFSIGENAAKNMADGFAEGQGFIEIIITEGLKKQSEWEKLNYNKRLGVYGNYIKAAGILSNTFLEDNKAINAGLIVADTAVGVMKAIATSSNIYEGFANAAVVVATGIAQLSSLSSATKGGGSIGGSSPTPSTETPPDFQQDTSTLDISDATAGGSETQTIRFATDSGDDLVDAIAAALNKANSEGRT